MKINPKTLELEQDTSEKLAILLKDEYQLHVYKDENGNRMVADFTNEVIWSPDTGKFFKQNLDNTTH